MNTDASGTNAAGSLAAPEGVSNGLTAAEGVNAPESPLNAIEKHVVKRTYKPTGNPVGRPSKALLEFRKQIKAESKTERRPRAPKFGPPVPEGLGWGGARRGAGRPKRIGPPAKKISMVRMDRELAAKLEALPKGKRSEYVRQALDLMKDLQPPDKFLASGKEKVQDT